MLFCCHWRIVETSCHKHFVVVFRHQQTPPLTTSDKCHYFPLSGGTVLITTSRSQCWQHAMKPDTDRKSRLLLAPPAFNAPAGGGGVPVRILPWCLFGMEKNKMVQLLMVKNFWRYVYSFRQNPRTWRTDGRTDRMTACIGRACIASRGNKTIANKC